MSDAHAALGLLFVLVGAVVVAVVSRNKRPLSLLSNLVLAAIVLRLVGSMLRHFVLTDYYNGVGDALRYYFEGLRYADAIHQLDWDGFFDVPEGAQWWGTQVLEWFSGIVLALIGPTLRGEFLLFGLIGAIGCMCFAVAFARNSGREGWALTKDYAWLIFLWPSMWFWPSSIGKEALLLCGLGVAVLGYVGRRGHIRWGMFGAGVLMIFVIRPHVATVLLASVMIAEWFGGRRRWTVARTIQAIASVVVFILILQKATAQFGFDATDLEGATEFFEFRAGQTQAGGSQIASVGGGIAGVFFAYINILFRPFIFEAHNIMALFSALEMTALWIFAWRRRRRIVRALKNWRHDRLLRIGLPMTVLYVLMIGLTFSNLGIIARQRVLVMPFLFALLVGKTPERAKARSPQKGQRVPRLFAPVDSAATAP